MKQALSPLLHVKTAREIPSALVWEVDLAWDNCFRRPVAARNLAGVRDLALSTPNLSCKDSTAEDLKDLGVGFVGDRRKLLDAIAACALGRVN